MKHHILIILLLGLTFSVLGQKSKVMAVKQMIDAGKYDEAKEAIELAVLNDRTSRWHRTYYVKGLLCQTAYETGVEKNESKKINLYPDQLFVAYDSYEKALELDVRERMHSQIRQQYYRLANDFRSMGEELYKKKAYKESLRAFEHALLIGESDLISAKNDTNLVYNTAMAAYESQNWETATEYLSSLHEDAHSVTTTLLLAMTLRNAGDTVRSEEVLMEGVELFHYDESVLIFLVNELVRSGRMEPAITYLNKAIEASPENFLFLWARGLVYRRMNDYDKAILSFRKAALRVAENDDYLEIREQYLEKFREAVKWLERSYELDRTNEKTITRLNQLYYQLQMKEEQKSLDLVN